MNLSVLFHKASGVSTMWGGGWITLRGDRVKSS